MPLDAKIFDLGWPPGLEVLGIQKHPNRCFYHPWAWPQDVETFEFQVFRPEDLELESFNMLGHAPGC